jgi:hypothetical protein
LTSKPLLVNLFFYFFFVLSFFYCFPILFFISILRFLFSFGFLTPLFHVSSEQRTLRLGCSFSILHGDQVTPGFIDRKSSHGNGKENPDVEGGNSLGWIFTSKEERL